MAQQQQRSHSHVPKFGNWDGDNVPYTAYFEKARKEKAGGIIINPNDPQQNPEAFNKAVSPSIPDPDNESYRSVSVPKFGQWDENDPKSGDGFTVIFNKVKEEKQIAAAKFPPVPIQTTNNYQATVVRQEKEIRKKKCCCLF